MSTLLSTTEVEHPDFHTLTETLRLLSNLMASIPKLENDGADSATVLQAVAEANPAEGDVVQFGRLVQSSG
jgi:hypothetical protein